MISPIVFIMAMATQNPDNIDLIAHSDERLVKCTKECTVILIAQKYGDSDPHGKDPHGDDSHDEKHDKELPANKEHTNRKAPKDVYGSEVPNDQQPY